MKLRTRYLILALLLGAALAVLPGVASSETTPTIEATGSGYYGGFSWSPSQVTIGAGGTVAFANHSSEVPHGVIWTSAVKPTCSSGVPVGEGHFGTQWSGTCTFAQAGSYTFECSVHHREMTGTITVNPGGTTTVTMTMGTTTFTSTTPTVPPKTTPTPTPKHHATSNAKKLAKALKACKKKPKSKRAACRRRAHKKYGAKRK